MGKKSEQIEAKIGKVKAKIQILSDKVKLMEEQKAAAVAKEAKNA